MRLTASMVLEGAAGLAVGEDLDEAVLKEQDCACLEKGICHGLVNIHSG